MEIVASQEVADRILQTLGQDYFDRYAVIAYLSHVEVVRGDKYV